MLRMIEGFDNEAQVGVGAMSEAAQGKGWFTQSNWAYGSFHSTSLPPTLVQSAAGGVNPWPTTLNVTAGNLLIIAHAGNGAGSSAVTDNLGNIYNLIGSIQCSSSPFGNYSTAYVWYSQLAYSGTLTITQTGTFTVATLGNAASNNGGALFVAEYTNIDANIPVSMGTTITDNAACVENLGTLTYYQQAFMVAAQDYYYIGAWAANAGTTILQQSTRVAAIASSPTGSIGLNVSTGPPVCSVSFAINGLPDTPGGGNQVKQATNGSTSGYVQFDDQTTWTVGYHLLQRNVGTDEYVFLSFMDHDVTQVGIRYRSSTTTTASGNDLEVFSGSTSLQRVPSPAVLLVWHFVEMQVTIGSGSSGSWEVRWDGVTIMSGTGDTQFTGSASANQISFQLMGGGGGYGPINLIDNLYIIDGQSGDLTGFVGPSRIVTTYPGSDSSVTFVPDTGVTNFSRLNHQVPDRTNSTGSPPDSTTQCVTSDLLGDIDLYGMAVYPGQGVPADGIVQGVAVNLYARAEDDYDLVAGTGFTIVQSAQSARNVSSLAFPDSVTAGNLLLVALGEHTGSMTNPPTVTDTLGNTWTQAVFNTASWILGGEDVSVLYAVANASGATTVSVSGSGFGANSSQLILAEVSGTIAEVDVVGSQAEHPPTMTTTQRDVVFTVSCAGGGTGAAVTSPEVIIQAIPPVDGECQLALSVTSIRAGSFTSSLSSGTFWGGTPVNYCSVFFKLPPPTVQTNTMMKQGGTSYDLDTVTLAYQYTAYVQILPANPVTTTSWLLSDVAAAQFGFKNITG